MSKIWSHSNNEHQEPPVSAPHCKMPILCIYIYIIILLLFNYIVVLFYYSSSIIIIIYLSFRLDHSSKNPGKPSMQLSTRLLYNSRMILTQRGGNCFTLVSGGGGGRLIVWEVTNPSITSWWHCHISHYHGLNHCLGPSHCHGPSHYHGPSHLGPK